MTNDLPLFVKYGKLKALTSVDDIKSYSDRDFFVSEKIDGGNCQIRNLNGRIIGGSRANYLRGEVLKRRAWFSDFNSWLHLNTSLYNLPENLVLFGEWSGNHTIDYGQNNGKFFVLDLLDLNTGERGKFIEYPEVIDYLKNWDIGNVDFLPVLHQGKLNKTILERLLNEKSDYYPGTREGLILKSYKEKIRLKIYHSKFTEKNFRSDGSIDFLTPARFRKAIFRIYDRFGKNICLDSLLEEIILDIETEERVSLSTDKCLQSFWKHYKSGELMNASKVLSL